jgi:CDP-diglyceride synthetase
MSISSMAEDAALRLAPANPPVIAAAAAGVAPAPAGPATTTVATSPSPLATLVKYIPTETITLYVAIQAALGDIRAPKNGKISAADFTSRWIWMLVIAGLTVLLTLGLSYRAQKNASATFRLPYFEVLAGTAAFFVWALSLPSTPLRDIGGYDYSAWNSVIILGGTVAIATTAYVLGKTVSWQKVLDA